MMLMNRLSIEFNGIRFLTVDPGALKTKMTADANAMPFFIKLVRGLIFQSPEKGAAKLYQGAFGEQFQHKTGIYVSGNKVKAIKLLSDKDALNRIFAGLE